MAKHLLVVESPAKARTIKKYLGPEFQVLASYGHVRDLVPKEGAVDPEHDFAMRYELIERNARHVEAIARAMRRADALYLATDPDREGEAISWHVAEILRERELLDEKPLVRVVFHEITRKAIEEAMEHGRGLDEHLVDAQQARRALDYLVGFTLSPLLWKKVRPGLSAGRVQSPALRLIVEREEEIEAFVPREYWSIEADVRAGQPFQARLARYRGEKVEQFTITSEKDAFAVQAALTLQAAGKLDVLTVEKKQRRRNPAPPFTTSTLQQEASRKLGFTAQRTMRVAQQLYEGVEAAGSVGLITYMRTDSVSLAAEAVSEMRAYIKERFGPELVPGKPRAFRTRSKNAQEAHEAIRPTSIARTPEQMQGVLSRDQARLYELIWKRALASQMQHALIDTVAVELGCGEGNVFRATGSTIASPGFLTVYEEGRDTPAGGDETGRMLPPMEPGDKVALDAIRAEQHFTEPPPRYSEATLVKTLEEYGIGRPSTYASIISTLQQRGYVELEKRRFHPTDVGRVVSRFLTGHFARYVDYEFTARLEDDLDAIARGEKEWIPVLRAFWEDFQEQVRSKKELPRSEVTQEATDESCPECGSPLSIRLGRRGRFIGCTAYPECKYTRNLPRPGSGEGEAGEGPARSGTPEEAAREEALAAEVAARECPRCSAPLVLREGRYGKFIGCSAYPKCRYLESLEKPEDTGVGCPECGKGTLLKRRSRRGKTFFSCSTYPDCKYAVWNEPLAEPCPTCAWPILTLKTTKRRGTEKVCPRKECSFSEPVEAPPLALSEAG